MHFCLRNSVYDLKIVWKLGESMFKKNYFFFIKI